MAKQIKNGYIWVFFGTSSFSVIVLEELKKAGLVPAIIVTTEDKPKGRNLLLTPPEVKTWAEKEKVPFIQPKTLKDQEITEKIKNYSIKGFDFFLVASYGKIIPQSVIDIPKHRTLNIHPSLLPRLRGASPIQSAILKENETGVTIIRIDSLMDHGPIIAKKKIEIDWPPYAKDLENILAIGGAKLLLQSLPLWLAGKITEMPQDETRVTLCEKIQKTNGQINLADDPEKNLRKIRAYNIWPGAYFFSREENKKRIIVKRAHIEEGKLILDRVVPEGKKEMDYSDFLKGNKI